MIKQMENHEIDAVDGGGLYELAQAIAAEIVREILENARPQV